MGHARFDNRHFTLLSSCRILLVSKYQASSCVNVFHESYYFLHVAVVMEGRFSNRFEGVGTVFIALLCSPPVET